MKNVIFTTAVLVSIGSYAVSGQPEQDGSTHILDLIVDSFERAHLATPKAAANANKQVAGSDYKKLVDDSFRRAGMPGPESSKKNPQDQ